MEPIGESNLSQSTLKLSTTGSTVVHDSKTDQGPISPKGFDTKMVDRAHFQDSNVQQFYHSMSRYTENVIAMTIAQGLVNQLTDSRQEQREDYERWSRYYSEFGHLAEDKERQLRTTQNKLEQAQKQLDEAREKCNQAVHEIATSIFPTSQSGP
ncbi:MAG: hypothetical protein Q9184_001790 [Pyrenodesmia sp. 2 TL-2023]